MTVYDNNDDEEEEEVEECIFYNETVILARCK